MQVLISGKNIDVGDSLRSHITQELTALINKYLGDGIESHVVISKDHHLFVTEISVHVSRHLTIRSNAHDSDAYRSSSQSIDKIEHRLQRHRNRLRDRKRHKEEIDLTANSYVLSSNLPEEQDGAPLVIAEMTESIPTLSVGDAVMQLDLVGSPAMMFKNSSSGELNVVYRRADGNIGWIDPRCTRSN